VTQFRCRDCEYSTEEECFAQDHENETGHTCKEYDVRPVMDEAEGAD
jgi:hypothetical protein